MPQLYAILLTTFSGLCTGIGGIIAFFGKGSKKFLALALGFSAGVMIYVSMIELFPEGLASIAVGLNCDQTTATIINTLAFFGGMLIFALIDKLVPSIENPHEVHEMNGTIPNEDSSNTKLKRLGILSAIAIAVHNFPEGIATFVSSMMDMSIALPIVFAVALHNIPEGIAVSAPIYYSTGSKKKALIYSFLSGLAEPLGAILAWLLLSQFLNQMVMGITLTAVAGIMVLISLDELLPASRQFGQDHLSVYGMILGMVVMAVSLIVL